MEIREQLSTLLGQRARVQTTCGPRYDGVVGAVHDGRVSITPERGGTSLAVKLEFIQSVTVL